MYLKKKPETIVQILCRAEKKLRLQKHLLFSLRHWFRQLKYPPGYSFLSFKPFEMDQQVHKCICILTQSSDLHGDGVGVGNTHMSSRGRQKLLGWEWRSDPNVWKVWKLSGSEKWWAILSITTQVFVVISTFKPGINVSSAEHGERFQTADTDLILLFFAACGEIRRFCYKSRMRTNEKHTIEFLWKHCSFVEFP